MSDPSKLDLSDYFGATVAGLISGIGGAMAWFIGSKNKLNARMDAQDEKMNGHTTQLAVIHSNQHHMTNRLDEIRECTNATNEKLSDLSDTLMQVLVAVKKN